MELAEIEIVEDLTSKSRCDEGFLRVARLRIRNVYRDGSRSEVYPCDVVSRPGSDAVVALLYEIDDARRILVLMRRSPRAPIYLRRHKRFVHPDPCEYVSIAEVVAGLVEEGDGIGPSGLRHRAALEAEEEAGCRVPPELFHPVGGETFASPGTSDEKLYYCAGPVRVAEARVPSGDGSVMEECAELVVRELAEAIEACRRGEIPDMKSEVGLLRLADHLGYIPQLRLFAHELPPELRARYSRLGIDAAPERGARA